MAQQTYANIDVIGRIWMPNTKAAMTYRPRVVPSGADCYGDDLEAPERGLPADWREAIDQWLATHAGDFQMIDDFSAYLPDRSVVPWATEDSELAFYDCFADEDN